MSENKQLTKKDMYIGELFDDIKPDRLLKVYPNVDFSLEMISNVVILRGKRI